MPKDFTFTVTDPRRVTQWLDMIGTKTVCITSPYPEYAELPGFDEPQLVYQIDLDLITPEQRKQMIAFVCRRFGLDRQTVETELAENGMPVLAEHGFVTIHNPQKWL